VPQPVREWVVASAIVERDDELLLVLNRRRGGSTDWSTPGGVIDPDDASVLHGLTREVEEETGLRVHTWDGPLYEVHAEAVDLGWRMRCEVYRAVDFGGELRVDDPDGIVIDAAFVPVGECAHRLAACLRWVSEPLTDWLADRWAPAAARGYRYGVRGSRLDDIEVVTVDIR
jgi:8-oxo-dGTP diphosphatase